MEILPAFWWEDPTLCSLGIPKSLKKKKPNTEIRYYYFKLLQIWGWQIKMQILMAFLIRRCGSLPTDALQKPDGLFSASANRCWGLETIVWKQVGVRENTSPASKERCHYVQDCVSALFPPLPSENSFLISTFTALHCSDCRYIQMDGAPKAGAPWCWSCRDVGTWSAAVTWSWLSQLFMGQRQAFTGCSI